MDKKIKIKSKSSALFGKKVNLPIDGEVEISTDGTLEVSEKCANLLVEKTEHYSYVESETKKDDSKDDSTKKVTKPVTDKKADKKAVKVEKTEELEDEEDESEEDESENEDEQEDEETEDEDDSEDNVPLTKESLNELEIEDLISILKDAEIEEDKYSKFVTKKGLLINFILKTIK